MEVDDNILLIVGDLQGILDQQLMPHPNHFLNIIILINQIKLYSIKKLRTISSKGRKLKTC
jgi:hypothetical protein